MNFQDIKLVALDIDGTLLTSQSELAPSTAATIAEVQQKGIAVTLASGRTFGSASIFARGLNIGLPIIAYNGAYIGRAADRRPLRQSPMDRKLAGPLIRQLEQANLYIKVYIDDKLYVQRATEETRRFSRLHRVQYLEVGQGNLVQLDRDPLKITVIDDPQAIDEIYRLLEPWQPYFNICRDSDGGLEIVKAGISKGSALREVCRLLQLDLSQVLAFGNEGNDLEMIREAGIGVAMGNAYSELKEQATMVAGTNDELGVEQVLRTYLLGKLNDRTGR